jgi:hypothetical protein
MPGNACIDGLACWVLAFASRWKDLIPLVGSITVAITAAVAAWRLNVVIKQTDVFLKFAERYHDILQAKHQLQLRSDERAPDGTPTLRDEQREKEAYELYRQFFGLMYDEYVAYRRGFLARDLVIEWMRWRNYECHSRADGQPNFAIAGISYMDGWNHTNHPVLRSEFVTFLEAIHALPVEPDERTAKRAIKRVVRHYGTRFQRLRARIADNVRECAVLWTAAALVAAAALLWQFLK